MTTTSIDTILLTTAEIEHRNAIARRLAGRKVTIDEAIEAMPDAQPVTLAYGGEDWTLELDQADADLLDASVDSAITRL